MARVFVVLALLAMMVGLDALKVESHADGHPLTLAAIGFFVLAAFAVAELGARLSLPKVTGYVLSGIAVGPFAANIVSFSVVDELQMFKTLALGLIATTAGLEIDLRALFARTRTLAVTIVAKVVTGSLLVGGGVLALAVWTDLPGVSGWSQAWALAFVFAVVSLGTSPAIAVAVASESSAKGPLTALVLDAAIVKDLLVAVCLAVAIAGGNALIAQAGIGPEVFVEVGGELGTSVVAGILVGGALIALLRLFRSQLLLFVGATIVVVAELSAVLHLNVFVVFIVAGLIVRNASNYADALRQPLQTISFPVFVVFFTTMGAGLDLRTIWRMLPAAAFVCCARALAYFISARLGGVAGKESEPVRRLAWLGYLPQAEVTLSLVVVAAAGLPDLADSIVALGTATVALNLLLGPVALGFALRAAGETGIEVSDAPVASQQASKVTALEQLAPALRKSAADLRGDLERTWKSWVDETIAPKAMAWTERLLMPDESTRAIAGQVVDRLDRIPPHDAEERLTDVHKVLSAQLGRLDGLPVSESVPLEPRHARVQPEDGFWVRWRKRIRTVAAAMAGRSGRRYRIVPVRLIARTSLEPRIVRVAEETLRDWQRYEISTLEALQRAAIGTVSVRDINSSLTFSMEQFLVKVHANIHAGIDAGMREAVTALAGAGASGFSSDAYRYSRVQHEVADGLRRIDEDALAWREAQMGAVDTLKFIARVEHAQDNLTADIIRDVATPLDDAFGLVERVVEQQAQRLGTLPELEQASASDEEWERLKLRAHAILPKPVLKELRVAEHRVHRATSSSACMTGLLDYLHDRDEEIRIVSSLDRLSAAPRPARVATVLVDVGELKEAQFAGQLLPKLERLHSEVAQSFSELVETLREVAALVEVGFDTADEARAIGRAEGIAKFAEVVERAQTLLDSARGRARTTWSRRRDEILASVTSLSSTMFDAVVAAAGGKAPYTMDGQVQRARHRAFARVAHLVERVRRWTGKLQLSRAGQAAGDLAHLYRVRAGIEQLDARGIRELVLEQEQLRRTDLPAAYAELFSPEPVFDPRLFVANRDALDSLIEAERTWQSNASTGNSVLVVGHGGTGKTSLIGVARLKLSSRRVVRLRGAAEGEAWLIGALAQMLGTQPTIEALVGDLQRQRVVVIIDDLHHWFGPGTQGVNRFDEFLALMAQTQPTTFWLATMSGDAFEVWSHIVPLTQAFASIPRLQPLPARELQTVLSTRHNLSGLKVVFPSTFWTRLAKRLFRRSSQATFIRSLAAVGHGNLRRAMQLWLAHADVEGHVVTLRPIHGFAWGLPFARQLPPAVKALLATLLRHGAVAESVLAHWVGMSRKDTHQLLRFLVASGLVEFVSTCDRYAVRVAAQDDLTSALASDGILPEVGR